MPSDLPELSDAKEATTTISTTSILANSIINQPADLETIEKSYIYYVLSQTDWQKAKAAKLLGIDVSTLYRKIERYKLQMPEQVKQ